MVMNDKLHNNNSHSIYSLMFLPVLSLSLLPTPLSVVVSSCLYAFQCESRDHSIFPRGWLIYIYIYLWHVGVHFGRINGLVEYKITSSSTSSALFESFNQWRGAI